MDPDEILYASTMKGRMRPKIRINETMMILACSRNPLFCNFACLDDVISGGRLWFCVLLFIVKAIG